MNKPKIIMIVLFLALAVGASYADEAAMAELAITSPDSMEIQIGTGGTLTAVVSSAVSNAPDTTLAVSGPPVEWVTVYPERASIPKDGTRAYAVTLEIPAYEQERTIPMTISAVSGTGVSASKDVEILLVYEYTSAGTREAAEEAGTAGAATGLITADSATLAGIGILILVVIAAGTYYAYHKYGRKDKGAKKK